MLRISVAHEDIFVVLLVISVNFARIRFLLGGVKVCYVVATTQVKRFFVNRDLFIC